MRIEDFSPTSVQRLLSRVPQGKKDQCWIAQGCKTSLGYGRGSIARASGGSKYISLHRLAYLNKNGEIPDGLFVLHRCDNPPCCNPDHLFLGTTDDNMADMKSKGRQSRISGESHHRAVLTQVQVDAIRADTRSNYQIAKDYSVSNTQVWRIKNKLAWRSS